jgi:hypothetical protein
MIERKIKLILFKEIEGFTKGVAFKLNFEKKVVC